MNKSADKTTARNSHAAAHALPEKHSSELAVFQPRKSLPLNTAQEKLQQMADSNPRVKQLKGLQDMADKSPQALQAVQLKALADKSASQQVTLQKKANNTGLPGNLKSGIEHLSGYAMDDVKVNFNSSKPAGLRAHAYAQGTDIHIAPGQEKHLPHEAWHVVQQKQGRVKATMQMKGAVPVNDDKDLEKEADVMGTKAIQLAGKETELSFKHGGNIAVENRNTQPDGVVQRIIIAEGVTYTINELAQFREKYGKDEKYVMNALGELTNAPASIEAALKDPRNIQLLVDRDGDKVYFDAIAEEVELKMENKGPRQTGRKPVLIQKPGEGEAKFNISGLIMCIGVVIEAFDGEQVIAASGSHFVTPACIYNHKINEDGLQLLTEQLAMMPKGKKLMATLVRSENKAKGDSEKNSDPETQAIEAIALIKEFLEAKGVAKVDKEAGESSRDYYLSSKGIGELI